MQRMYNAFIKAKCCLYLKTEDYSMHFFHALPNILQIEKNMSDWLCLNLNLKLSNASLSKAADFFFYNLHQLPCQFSPNVDLFTNKRIGTNNNTNMLTDKILNMIS